MKRFQQWVFIFGLALAGQARAAEGGAPTAEAGKAAYIEGKVIVANIAPGRAAITAVFLGEPVADWVAEDVTVTVAPGQTRKDVLVRAMKGGVAVITVLSRNGRKPLANMPVSISSELSPSPIIAMTGADGVARLRLLPDRWSISGNLEEPNDGRMDVMVATGRTNKVEVFVDPGLKITGTVRNPDGAPARGAVVSFDDLIGSSHEVRTDANGRFEIAWKPGRMMDDMFFGGGSMFLTARSTDRNLVVIHDMDENTTNLELTLQPGVTLLAKVEDPAGRPVTNAAANASRVNGNRNSGAAGIKPSLSDAQGHIEIAGVPRADSYYLEVIAKGYGSMSRQMPMSAQPTNRLEFPTMVLPLANQKLGGQILDTNGRPVAGVTVQAVAVTNVVKPVAGQPDAWEVVAVRGRSQGSRRTDGEGRFFFEEVCEGPIQLDILYGGPSVSAQTIGGTTNILLRLDLGNVRNNNVPRPAPNPVAAPKPATNAGITITGTVRDPSGAPAGGVRLRLWGFPVNQEEVTTGSDGRYSLTWRKSGTSTQLVMFARDLEHNLAASHEIDGTTTNIDLSLQPGLTLSVKVQDVNGKPMPSARATFVFMYWNLSQIPAVADEQGLIEIKALPQGRRYTATVTSRGYNAAEFQAPAEKTQTNHFDFPTVVLKAADQKLAGRVLSQDSKPVAGANVDTRGEGQPNLRTTTDDQGHFAFDGLFEEPVSLFADARGAGGNTMSGSVWAQGGDSNVVLRFGVDGVSHPNEKVLTTTGTVLDPAGEPVSGARLSIATLSGRQMEFRSEADGKYSITWQAQKLGGWRWLFIYARDEERHLALGYDVDDTTTNLDLRLQPALAISVKVRDAQGKPIPTATEMLFVYTGNVGDALNPFPAKADDQGVIEVKDLPQAQRYLVSIKAPGYGMAELRAQIEDTKTNRFEFPVVVLKAADRKLAGQVLGPDGKPVPGANVYFQGEGQSGTRTRTDARGRFAFGAVSEGTVQVVANTEGGGANFMNVMNGSTQAQAGDTNTIVKLILRSGAPAAGARGNGRDSTNPSPPALLQR